MYIVKDTVECGYFDNKEKGGTIDISIPLEDEFRDLIPKLIEIIDYFDHCVVTDDIEVVKFSERYFLINNKINFLEDIARCIAQLLSGLPSSAILGVKITLGKVSVQYTAEEMDNFPDNIIDYSVKG